VMPRIPPGGGNTAGEQGLGKPVWSGDWYCIVSLFCVRFSY
jgi:hypothetical protein